MHEFSPALNHSTPTILYTRYTWNDFMLRFDRAQGSHGVELLVDSASGYRLSISNDTVDKRTRSCAGNWPTPETYKIHVACFSGIDVERVAIYAEAFSSRRNERGVEVGASRRPLGSRGNLIDRKRGWDIGFEIGLDRCHVTVLRRGRVRVRLRIRDEFSPISSRPPSISVVPLSSCIYHDD